MHLNWKFLYPEVHLEILNIFDKSCLWVNNIFGTIYLWVNSSVNNLYLLNGYILDNINLFNGYILDNIEIYLDRYLEQNYDFAGYNLAENFADRICNIADNIQSASGDNSAGSGSNALASGLDPSYSYTKAEVLNHIYNKIQAQLDYNKSSSYCRYYNIYSDNHPVSAQLCAHEKAVLHKHLLDLNKDYDFRMTRHGEFRMYVSHQTKEALKATNSLLSDIQSAV